MSLYDPYSSLTELLTAAGVPAGRMNDYTTPELLEMAARRRGPVVKVKTLDDRIAWATRSVRIPFTLEQEVDRIARAAGTNFNQIATKLLQEFVDGQKSR